MEPRGFSDGQIGQAPRATFAAMTEIRGRRVIVTGGASGIGRATSELVAERGGRVVVLDVDAEAGADLARATSAAGGELSFVQADISSAEAATAAVSRALGTLGGVDALISAAGIMRGQMQAIADFDEDTWDRVLEVNLKGAFLISQQIAPVMVEQGDGAIILVGSKAGVTVGSGSIAYGASKAGVHGLALTLDRHLGPQGIRVNEVCPGDVDTPLYRRSIAEGIERGGDPIAAEEALARLTPVRSVAEILAFLVSDAASAVRGTVFTS
jgi:NAD(P)-dependent dehydrogenase (short-subunit alcohol dehydrogenase family)